VTKPLNWPYIHGASLNILSIAMWEARFDKPIRLGTGKAMHTLRDAAEHVIALPHIETQQSHWQNALACLLAAAERRGPVKTARIAMVKALASGKTPPSERLRAARSLRIIK
jgi:hypothetical protein